MGARSGFPPPHGTLQVTQPLPNPAWTCPSTGSLCRRASPGSCPTTDGQLVQPQRGGEPQGEVTGSWPELQTSPGVFLLPLTQPLKLEPNQSESCSLQFPVFTTVLPP